MVPEERPAPPAGTAEPDRPPELRVLGTIEELTRGGVGGGDEIGCTGFS